MTDSVNRVFEFTTRVPDTIPKDVLRFASILLVDTIAVAAAATGMEAGRIARDIAVEQFSAPHDKAVPIMFDGRMASPVGAAFAAASQIDNLDAHDGYNPTLGHIGCAVVPALFAWAAKLPNLSGREALTAFVVGYEVATRAAIALHATVSDYHTSGAWNGLGVAAMGVRLHGASQDVLRQSLGIAEYHGPRSQMMREIANPTMLHDGSGMGAMTGMMAYEMAAKGFTGAPAITLESEGARTYWDDLGTKWTVPLNYIKPYPICRWAHGAIDAVRRLKLDHAINAANVASMAVRTFDKSAKLFPGMPDTTSKAQYSLAFALATILRHGRIGVEHISGTALTDPATEALLSCITIVEEPRHTARFPAGRWADVTITLNDGTVLESGDTNPRGGPEAPMSVAEIREKFDQFASASLSTKRANAIWETGLSLTNDEVKFSDLSCHVLQAVDTDA
ncbi:MmgE/PrpD family protein [Pseudahrensia aquimaris]|uniref:MmgE/PrpD family protein n=1 Tax=Pseudahrensia aquimaris TaxID=744461 RepID=A0ABW3FFS0_9HYPH